MVVANQQAAQQKQNELKAKIAPLALGIKNLQTGIQGAYSQYRQAHPEFEGDFDQWKTGPGAQQFQQFVDQTGHAVHSMREILHPDHQSGPTDWLKTHLTDRMHITNADHRAEDQANQAAWNKYGEAQSTQAATKITLPDETPAAKQEQLKQKGAQALEDKKSEAAQKLETQKAAAAQSLELQKTEFGMRLQKEKDEQAQKIEADKVREQDKKEDDRMQVFNRSQERIEREHGKAAPGTWAVVEDESGKPKLFNSKTGEEKDAPEGMHKSGYYAKQVAPLEAADSNISDYIGAGVFTGPGDLSLQHEFFTATQPSTGFRMTKVQQDILADSQSWMNSLRGKAHHALTGTWFSDEQRKQIASEAQKAIAAKKQALGTGGPKTDQLRQMQGGPSDDDIIKALSGAK
jgi:hypothetical protein